MPRLALFFALALLALSPFASADIPHLISLQGKLTDAADNPLSSSTNFVFKVFPSATGGTALWTESRTGANAISPDTLGIFSALLGSVVALNIPFNESYWLEVQVQSGTGPTQILSPRTRMGSAGYALRSESPWNATGNNIYATNAGNVGIGTNAPTEKLEVAGNVKATAFKGDGSQLTGISPSQWTNSGSNIYYNAGNVGIGTASPNAKLDVKGDLILNKAGGIGQEIGRISFQSDGNPNWASAIAGWIPAGSEGIDFVDLRFYTQPAYGGPPPQERMRITPAGNVGIGTTSPGAKLEVVGGDINVPSLTRNNCYWTAWSCGDMTCNEGYFMAGFGTYPSSGGWADAESCWGAAIDTDEPYRRIYCCQL